MTKKFLRPCYSNQTAQRMVMMTIAVVTRADLDARCVKIETTRLTIRSLKSAFNGNAPAEHFLSATSRRVNSS